MRFRVEQTIGYEAGRSFDGSLGEVRRHLNDRLVSLTCLLSSIPLGRFKSFAGPYGANWRVERIA